MGVEGRGREMEMAGPVLVTVTQIHKLISVHTRDYHVFWPSNEGSVPAESESLISDIHLEAS